MASRHGCQCAHLSALFTIDRSLPVPVRASVLVREFQSSDRVAWRFLKARKFDVAKTAAMFEEAVAMRKAKELDTMLERPCPKALDYKIVSRHGLHGYDQYGRPVFIKNTGWQNFPALYAAGTLEERVNYNAYTNEYLRRVVIPEANARVDADAEIDQVVTIVNLVSQLDSLQ